MVVARRQTLVQLTDDLVVLLDAIAAKQGTTRSALIRSVLENYVGRGGRGREGPPADRGLHADPAGLPRTSGARSTRWAEARCAQARHEEPWEPSER